MVDMQRESKSQAGATRWVGRNGLTLMELLIAMGILAIMLTATVLILNPNEWFAQARNTERLSEISVVANAIGGRIADNRGTWNTTCGIKTVSFPTSTTSIGTDVGLVDLGVCLVPAYLVSVPVDPSGGTAGNTGYQISQDAAGHITVGAPNAELGKSVSVTR